MRKLLSLLLCAALLLPASALADTLQADARITTVEMSDLLYGLFYEDINYAADGGLYAELLQNRSFEYEDVLNPKNSDHYTGWQFNLNIKAGGKAVVMTEQPLNENNTHYMRVTAQDAGYRFANGGYGGNAFSGGVVVQAGKRYKGFVYMRSAGYEGEVEIALQKRAGGSLARPLSFTLTDQWQKYELSFECEEDGKGVLGFVLNGTGSVDVDMASLMPEDVFGADWPNGGLRADLVQALMELQPRFLRFPGGCIAEGSYYRHNFYNWKDTVGPVEKRRENFNTWGYMQSYGLGFYEYFCLAEALGAQPLPVVHAGMLCQARDVFESPLTIAETKEYAQDILDLIEFATGDPSTVWGGLRAEMGHPEPFDLNFLAIGNENWGNAYFTRYEVLSGIVREAYPDLTLVVAAGPVAEGALIQDSWNNIRRRFSGDLVDEHYYMSPEWFLTHTHRYDHYPRKTPVFVGEYAAHEPVQGNRRPNTLYSALCEAAYMTGLERNSDVVKMASYAPLLARDGMQQWTPNLIWFNESEVLLTPNYHVQQMFSATLGDQVVASTLETENDQLFHVVTRTEENLYVKLVNVAENGQDLTLSLSNVPDGNVSFTQLSGEKTMTNTFARPDRIAPVSGMYTLAQGQAQLALPAYSVTIITVPLH